MEWGLLALLVIQQVYWMSVTNKLVNKLMSRNYYEYKQSEREPKVREKKEKFKPIISDHELASFGPTL